MDKANTPDEIVDVIDENDNVVGTSTKKEVNSNPHLIHREITVLIFNEQNKVLIQQRSKYKKNNPLMWTISVAGHVPSGKSYEEAAHMELKEELGFDTKLVNYEKEIFREENETQMVTSFIGKFPKGDNVTINKDEIEVYRFVTQEELEEINEIEEFEQGSLGDFRRFFKGELDNYVKKLN